MMVWQTPVRLPFTALLQRHLPPHPDSHFPPLPAVSVPSFSVSTEEVAHAIRWPRSAKATASQGYDQYRQWRNLPLLTALAAFCSLVLEGKTPLSVRLFFFGANLVALKKKGGGVRPIAVGCILRRLVAKVAGNKVVGDMSSFLASRQLGYGISRGAEAAVMQLGSTSTTCSQTMPF